MTDSFIGSNSSITEAPIQWPMVKSSYNLGKSVGQGATSVVYEAFCPTTTKKCAIKIINLEKCSSSASLEEINRETKSMKNMKNENIVAYYGSFVDGIEICIVMDLCQRGSLLDVIKFIQSKRDITDGVFDENTIATILRDVLRGLVYIHENGLVHRDLKCGNLLVKDDGIIQIADFGVAGFLATRPLTATESVDMKRFTFVGTPCWMAPEVMQQARGYNQKADIWSLGITTIEMATGQAPYAKYAPMKVLMLTLQNEPPDIDTTATVANQYANYGHKFRKFTRSCLLKDPTQRLSARELLSHAYIKTKAKDRELLCRILLGGEMPIPAARLNKHLEDQSEKRETKNHTTEWNFDTICRTSRSGRRKHRQLEGGAGGTEEAVPDDSDYDDESGDSDKGAAADEGQTVANGGQLPTATSSSGGQTLQEIGGAAAPESGAANPSPAWNVPNLLPPPVPASTPVSPDGLHGAVPAEVAFSEPGAGQPLPAVAGTADEDVPTGPYYRITLRKRSHKPNNELLDISFNFVPGKDSVDVLARELVDEDLLDGRDLLLVAHNMSELVENPAAKERVFPLYSSPAPGQLPVESELHGYAKVLIQPMLGPLP